MAKGSKHRMEGLPTSIGSLFIDSGAHSLYNREADNGNKRTDAASLEEKYKFFDLKKGSEFRKFLEEYVAFIKAEGASVNFYVTLDAIYHPQRSWDITVCLEEEYGLKPVPVIHCHAPLKWISKYIDRGHTFIGIGGLGQGITKKAFLGWGDRVFDFLCSTKSRRPIVRTHGFAMTSWELLLRYPWYSVDSASWLKAAAFGQVYVPHKRGGDFVFTEAPYSISISDESPNTKVKGKHVNTLTKAQRAIVHEWFEKIGVDFTPKEGATQSDKLAVRATANLLYFEELRKFLVYPRTFEPLQRSDGFGLVGSIEKPDTPALRPQKEVEPMHVYYSGLSGGGVFPEVLIHDRNPDVMLSFDNLRNKTEGSTAWRRLTAHKNNLAKSK